MVCSARRRGFSLYDIEEYLKEAGAEKVNERALISFEKELEETVEGLVSEATVYANYAGRRSIIRCSDIELVNARGSKKGMVLVNGSSRKLHRHSSHAKSALNEQVRKLK